MGPLRIVKLEIGSYPEACFRNTSVIMEVDLFVFDGPPQSFNKNVVIHPAPAVHADSDTALFTEGRFQSDGYLPGNHISAKPVHDGYEVNKTVVHPDIGYVCCPDLIRMINHKISKQIGIFLMLRTRLAQIAFRIESFETHKPHEPANPLRVYEMPLAPQPDCHFRDTVKRRVQILLVDQHHQKESLQSQGYWLCLH